MTSGTTYGRSAPRSARTGTSACPASARPGTRATGRPSMAGTGGPQQTRAPPDGVSMNQDRARAMIQAHFDASNVGAAGGAPGDDIIRASEIYADDAVVEWPQGGERLRGKANIIGFR